MSTEGRTVPARARARFAELLERMELGESVDWESEWRNDPDLEHELRALHASWERAERLFSGFVAAPGGERPRVTDTLDGPWIPESMGIDPEPVPAPGRDGARYTEIEIIAQGGMGVVTRVRDRDLGRDLALKKLRPPAHPDGIAESRALRRFLQEARIAAQLQHPGILPVHDVGLDPAGRPYFTMPLVRGWTLAQAIEFAREGREGWSRARLLEALLKVCDAVAYAHEQGIVHRDLKPANVLVGRFGETYVTDWGLARRTHTVASQPSYDDEGDASVGARTGEGIHTAHGAVLGTVNYMAPEQARGDRAAVGPHSDVYSLGALLYHALSGRMPFAGLDEESALAALLRGAPTPIERLAPEVPHELVSVCEKSMARSPRERYGTPAEMAADLRAYMEGRVVSAHERGTWPEVRKWLARNRDALTWILLTLLVATGVTGVLAWREQHQRARNALLSDVQELDALQSEAPRLWPALPERTAAFERWVARAHALLDHLPTQQRELEALRSRSDGAEGERRFVFASLEEQWTHDTLARTVDAVQRLGSAGTETSLLAEVEGGLAFSREVARRSQQEAAAEWSAAIEAIGGLRRYSGLRLLPQIGLLPIGPDPTTGLWEFAHLATGSAPARESDGTLALGPESGVVLVLVPGGRSVMGSARPLGPGSEPDPIAASAGREPDLLAREDEGPCVEVELAPCFVAKHELTLAQRARIDAGSPLLSHRMPERGMLPVETVSWDEARTLLARVDLELPSEAQWEHAARAGG